jgi:hypothetical protein
MLFFQFCALVVAWASATYGIWTKENIDRRKAWVATSLTSLGFISGVALAVIAFVKSEQANLNAQADKNYLRIQLAGLNEKYADQKEHAQILFHQLQLALTGTELTSLDIDWKFTGVDQRVLNVFDIKRAIYHSRMYSNDEFSRLSSDTISEMSASWEIEDIVVPLIGIISSGESNLHAMYEGEVDEAIQAFRDGAPEIKDPEEVDFWPKYIGPKYDIIFPINKTQTAALALGKKEDDPRWLKPEITGEYLPGLIYDLTNYGFRSGASRHDQSFSLHWEYNKNSLKQATRGDGTVIAAFPVEFTFVALEKKSDDKKPIDYVEALRRSPQDNYKVKDKSTPSWMKLSEMTWIPNDIPEAAITYTVERIGYYDRILELSKYDRPEILYEYILFKARRKSSVGTVGVGVVAADDPGPALRKLSRP